MSTGTLVYLHGFRSSPYSAKASLLAAYFKQAGRSDEFICPQLPASPLLAMQLLEKLLDDLQSKQKTLTLIGSSLGGFYATYLVEQRAATSNIRALLINPAVKVWRNLAAHVGVSEYYHSAQMQAEQNSTNQGEIAVKLQSEAEFEFKREYIAELRAYAVDPVAFPERYLLMAATGDEVLDYREMLEHYPASKHWLIQGSDHGVTEFAEYLEEVLAFYDAKSV